MPACHANFGRRTKTDGHLADGSGFREGKTWSSWANILKERGGERNTTPHPGSYKAVKDSWWAGGRALKHFPHILGSSEKKPDGNQNMVARVILEVERRRARRAHGVGDDIFRKETEAGRTPSYRASAIFGGKQKGGVRMRFRGGGKGGLYT
jgi:hypothetical protein